MRNPLLFALALSLFSLAALLIWFTNQPDPPSLDNLSFEPSTSTCPGGTVLFRAVAFDADSWTIREPTADGERERAVGETTAAAMSIAVPLQVCPPTRLCIEALSRRGTAEQCIDIPVRPDEWLDELIFGPECPEGTSYGAVRIREDDSGGSRRVHSARNGSPDTITLTHEGIDGSVISETVGPFGTFLNFGDRMFHGTWSIQREAAPRPEIEQCRPADLPVDTEPPPGIAWIPSIPIEVLLTCNSTAASCS